MAAHDCSRMLYVAVNMEAHEQSPFGGGTSSEFAKTTDNTRMGRAGSYCRLDSLPCLIRAKTAEHWNLAWTCRQSDNSSRNVC